LVLGEDHVVTTLFEGFQKVTLQVSGPQSVTGNLEDQQKKVLDSPAGQRQQKTGSGHYLGVMASSTVAAVVVRTVHQDLRFQKTGYTAHMRHLSVAGELAVDILH
jgi:hypothetical protein